MGKVLVRHGGWILALGHHDQEASKHPNSSQHTQKSQGHRAGVRDQGNAALAALISTGRCPEPWKP